MNFNFPFKREKKKRKKWDRRRFKDLEDVVTEVVSKTRVNRRDIREIAYKFNEAINDFLKKGFSVIGFDGTFYTFRSKKDGLKKAKLKYKRKYLEWLNEKEKDENFIWLLKYFDYILNIY